MSAASTGELTRVITLGDAGVAQHRNESHEGDEDRKGHEVTTVTKPVKNRA